jgi:hypothetical protein
LFEFDEYLQVLTEASVLPILPPVVVATLGVSKWEIADGSPSILPENILIYHSSGEKAAGFLLTPAILHEGK